MREQKKEQEDPKITLVDIIKIDMSIKGVNRECDFILSKMEERHAYGRP